MLDIPGRKPRSQKVSTSDICRAHVNKIELACVVYLFAFVTFVRLLLKSLNLLSPVSDFFFPFLLPGFFRLVVVVFLIVSGAPVDYLRVLLVTRSFFTL